MDSYLQIFTSRRSQANKLLGSMNTAAWYSAACLAPEIKLLCL